MKIKLVDTHCHIHDPDFFADKIDEVYQNCLESEIYPIVVGTSEKSSSQAVEFANSHESSAIVGVHPHDTKLGWDNIADLAKDSSVVGIGEIGLDYFYEHSSREVQQEGLEAQLQIAIDHDLPVSFHVRDEKSARGAVWQDFWPIFDNFTGLKGVLHSFTDNQQNLDEGFKRGLLVGINGISTFTKDEAQQKLYATVPLEKILVETDSPYLTPVPFRGKMNEPKFVEEVAKHLATQRNVSFDDFCIITTKNARDLYKF
ncbi:preprotein translocase [Candidatus Saccharibacteria bacterium]|nr:MAG: preprotein translocase [Candidatus Saccharibacteria bacterium]